MKAPLHFWISLFLVLYTYLFLSGDSFLRLHCGAVRREFDYLTGRRNRPRAWPERRRSPASHNDCSGLQRRKHLEEKIANVRQTDYPANKLQVIFVSDGSTDRSIRFWRR